MIVKTLKRYSAHVYTVYDKHNVIVIRTENISYALHYEALVRSDHTAESLLQRDQGLGNCGDKHTGAIGPAAK